MPSSRGSNIQQNSNYIMYTYILLLVLAGTVDTISKKTLNIAHSLGKKFKHPFFVAFLMFLGETVALLFYYLGTPSQKPKSKENEKEESVAISQLDNNVNEKPELPVSWLILPTFLDFMATTLNTIGLTMMAGSSYQMMRGASILFVAILGKFYLKNKLYSFHYFAIFLVMFGLMLIGSANQIIPTKTPAGCAKSETETSSLMGYIFVFFSTFFVASQLTIEEELTKNYNVHPLKAVGWEGVFGSLFYAIILCCLQFVKCTPPPKGHVTWTTLMCTQNDKGEWLLEDSIFAIRQNLNNTVLLVNSIIFCLSVAAINFTGVTVTKIASAGARSITEPIRTITIWAFFMLPFVNHCHREHFNIVQFIGFLFLIAGNLIYNQIITLPFYKKVEDVDLESSKINANYHTISQELGTKNEKV